MQGVGDAGQRLPGDDRAGFHPWLTLTAVAAAAARSQLGGAHKARRDGPEQVRSTLVAARPPRRTHWTKGAPRPQVLARARPARCRIGPDRRDHAQAVCCPNSPPSPHFNAHAYHSRHHRIPSGNRPARPPQEGNTRVCRSAIASHRNRPTEPPTLPANMAKGRNRRRCTFSDRGCVNVRSQQLNRSKNADAARQRLIRHPARRPRALVRDAAKYQRRIRSAEPERIGKNHVDVTLFRAMRHEVHRRLD